LLSNVDTARTTLLQIILSGQLDLESLLARPELRQVQQRVSRRIRLEPLSEQELPAYIDHRLTVGRVAQSQLPGSSELARALDEWDGDAAAAGATFTADAVQAIWRRSTGLPRVINVLCDRALEEAYRDQVRTVDARLVERAAGRLEPVGDGFWAPAASAAQPPARTVPPGPDVFESGAPSKPRWPMRSVATLAGLAVVGGLAGWWLVNGPWRSATVVRRDAPSAAPPRATSPSAVPKPATPIPEAPAHTPSPAPASPTTAAPVAAMPAPSSEPPAPPTAAAAPVGAFEIVVASFRTEARAAEVTSKVKDAGVPVRQRATGGWQQVIAGPFPSREDAEANRARLDRAGLSGTQITPTSR